MAPPPLIFSRAALHELDRRAVKEFHIPILVLMENAGRAVAEAALKMLHTYDQNAPASTASVLILAGPGNNGGDGLVAARHLHNAGIPITLLVLASRDKFKDAAATQLAIIDAMKLHAETLSPGLSEFRDWLVDASPDALIIDALFGTGLSRPPEGLAAQLIRAANSSNHPILAIDIPSGLDCDTGQPATGGSPEIVIHATQTISFCGTKLGFTNPASKPFSGKVTTADIGAPIELLRALASVPES
jgi:NAD(P)H-hydrate epimerase